MQSPTIELRPGSPAAPEAAATNVADLDTDAASSAVAFPAAEQRRQSRLSRSGAGSCSLTTADLAAKWRDIFCMFDEDLDGVVTVQELGTKMRKLGCNPTYAEVQDLLHEWDNEDKGALTLSEFSKMMTKPSGSSCGAGSSFTSLAAGPADAEERLELRAAFELFDRDKDGVLSADEVRTALELLEEAPTDEELQFVMQEADANGDGVVSFKEFCSIVAGVSLSPMSPFYFRGRSRPVRSRRDADDAEF